MKTIACIGARMGSTRFPGKVFKKLGNDHIVLGWVVRAAEASNLVDEVWVCTTVEKRDDVIKTWCADYTKCWRGSETDVLRRLADCARHTKADIVVRLTGDCPFLDPEVIDQVIMLQRQTGVAYANNVDPPTYPDGLDVQVVTAEALYAADAEASRSSDRDTVCEYISRNRKRWPSATLLCGMPGLEKYRWVLDGPEDYEFCKAIVAEIGDNEPADLIRILEVLRRKPELQEINSKSYSRNERFLVSISGEVS